MSESFRLSMVSSLPTYYTPRFIIGISQRVWGASWPFRICLPSESLKRCKISSDSWCLSYITLIIVPSMSFSTKWSIFEQLLLLLSRRWTLLVDDVFILLPVVKMSTVVSGGTFLLLLIMLGDESGFLIVSWSFHSGD